MIQDPRSCDAGEATTVLLTAFMTWVIAHWVLGNGWNEPSQRHLVCQVHPRCPLSPFRVIRPGGAPVIERPFMKPCALNAFLCSQVSLSLSTLMNARPRLC